MPDEQDLKDKPNLSQKAKEFLLYAKIYRFFAFAALFLGFIASGIIYDNLSGGDFLILFKKPAYTFYLFAPFIPSVILALIAARKLKQFYKHAEKDGIDIKALRKRTELYSHKSVKN